MKPRHAATIALQSPVRPRYRDPATVAVGEVCPNCLRPATRHQFTTQDSATIETWHCKEHGDICPRRSAIANTP